MPDETELEDTLQNPQEEETPEETPEEEQETSEEIPEKEKETPEKQKPTSKEKQLFERFQKEKKLRLKAEGKLRDKKDSPKLPIQEEKDEKSAEKDAEDYLRRLTNKVLDERDKAKKEAEEKKDEVYQQMLDNFLELDEDFDEKKFSKLVKKYKPEDEDAAWAIWQDFKDKPDKTETKSKPKLPKGKQTIDEDKTTKYESKNDRKTPLWKLLTKAKKEHGIE